MPVGAMIGISLVGIGVNAYGQHKAGQAAAQAGVAQKAASDSMAGLSDYNAKVADLQAQDALDRGAVAEGRFRSQISGVIGTQRAGTAAGNIDVGYGSAAEVQGDAAYLGEIDALTIRNNAAREAWGYSVQAQDLRTRATIARKTGVYQEKAGQQAATAGNIAAVGTIASGTGSLLLQQYGMKH